MGEEGNALCDGDEGGDKSPRVEDPPLVGVVLDTNKVEYCPVGRLCYTCRPVRRFRQRLDARSELQTSAIVARDPRIDRSSGAHCLAPPQTLASRLTCCSGGRGWYRCPNRRFGSGE